MADNGINTTSKNQYAKLRELKQLNNLSIIDFSNLNTFPSKLLQIASDFY